MLSEEKSTCEIHCPIRRTGSTDGGYSPGPFEPTQQLTSNKAIKADATTRHSSNKSSNFKDLSLGTIPFFPRNQYTFLVSIILLSHCQLQMLHQVWFHYTVSSERKINFHSTSNTYSAQFLWRFLNHIRHSHISHSHQQD